MADDVKLDDFMENPEAFDSLSESDRARLFNGTPIDGDTDPAEKAGEESSEAPAAASEEVVPHDRGDEPEDPVVLAKDGLHTIPYSELEASRERARHFEQQAREHAAEIERLKAPKQDDPPKPAPTPAPDLDALERLAFDALLDGDTDKAVQLRMQINTELQERAKASLRQDLREVAAQQAAQESNQRFQTAIGQVIDAYPFLDSNAAGSNPEAIAEINAMAHGFVESGLTPDVALIKAVNRLAPIFAPAGAAPARPAGESRSTVSVPVAAPPKPKLRLPMSLSDIPAGSPAPADESEAMREMSAMNLMDKYAGKTPDQIEELMSRVI